MSIRLLLLALGKVRTWLELEFMEYPDNAAAQAAYVTNDSLDSYTKLLLHSDIAKATSVLAATGQTITYVGTADCVDAQSKFGGKSLLLDGDSDYITLVDSADWDFGAGDWTIDCWIRPNSVTAYHPILSQKTTDGIKQWALWTNGTEVEFYNLSGGAGNIQFATTGANLSVNNWFHIAWVHSGTTYSIYVNGVLKGSTINTNNFEDQTSVLFIGYDSYFGFNFNGYIDEFRISKGIARWTTDFIPPVFSYPNDLQCGSEATIKTQGDYSLKVIALMTDSLNKTLTKTFSPALDLSGKTLIRFDVRASRTGSNFKLGFHDSGGTTTEHTPNILVADAFQTETINISAVSDANKDAIDSLITTIINADAANTIYIDNIRYT